MIHVFQNTLSLKGLCFVEFAIHVIESEEMIDHYKRPMITPS